jgi:CheY-like chemotaxis protein
MPEVDGFEVCRRLRQTARGRRMFIVALTGWGQPEDRRRTHEAGFDHHLIKPVDPAALAAVVALIPDTSVARADASQAN